MKKTTIAPQAPQTKKAVIVYRAMGFLKPDPGFADGTKFVATSDETQWFHLRVNPEPQEVPEWVRKTKSYADAIACRYIAEVEVRVESEDGVIRPLMIPRPSQVIAPSAQPLAAETRPLDTYFIRAHGEHSGMGPPITSGISVA